MELAPPWREWGLVAAIALACAALSLVRFAPTRSNSVAVARLIPALRQLENPSVGLELAERLNIPNAIKWRLLPPVVGNLVGLPRAIYLAVPILTTALFLFFTCSYIRAETGSPFVAACGGVLVTTTSAFFVATGWVGQFDIIYIFALGLFLVSKTALQDWGICCLAPWCDERFLLILPAYIWVRAALFPEGSNVTSRRLVPILIGVAPYLAMRLWAIEAGDLSVAYQLRLQYRKFGDYLPSAPLGWWMGLRFGWVPVLSAIALAVRKRGPLVIAFLSLGIVTTTLLAWDVSRSAGVLVPILVIGVARWETSRRGTTLLGLLAALNLLLPAAHITEGKTVPISSILSTSLR